MLELNFLTWHRYDDPGYFLAYCIETRSMGHSSNDCEQAAIEDCLKFTKWELEERFISNNLTNWGWEITPATLLPPLVDVEKALAKQKASLVEIGYPENFSNFNHFKKLVEIPPARKP